MKKLLFIIPLFLYSCIFDNPKVKISNNSQITYDSIKVFSSENSSIIFENVKPKDVVKGRILFDKKNLGGEGCYSIQLYKGNKVFKGKAFDYHEGASLDNGFKIIIEPDTILINNNYTLAKFGLEIFQKIKN